MLVKFRGLESLFGVSFLPTFETDDDKAGGGGTGNDDKGAKPENDDDGKPQNGEHGFPTETPLERMTPDQREAYWRHQARKHEKLAKARGDYDDLVRQSEELRNLKKKTQTETEKALDEARETARTETRKEFATKLVDAHIHGLLADRLPEQRRELILATLDRTNFLTKAGDVDTDKVREYVDMIAPPKKAEEESEEDDDKSSSTSLSFRHGQGRRNSKQKASVATGADLYAAKNGKNST